MVLIVTVDPAADLDSVKVQLREHNISVIYTLETLSLLSVEATSTEIEIISSIPGVISVDADVPHNTCC